MADYAMVSPDEAKALGLSGTMVEQAELDAARARHREEVKDRVRAGLAVTDQEVASAVGTLASQEAAASDAALFESGPYEPQEGASDAEDVEVEAGVASAPSKRRRGASGGDAAQG